MSKGRFLALLGVVPLAGSAITAVRSGALATSGTTANALGATAPPAAATAIATTGPARFIGAHGATLEGTINPSGSPPIGSAVRVYFQLGTTRAYGLQSTPQRPPARSAPFPVHVSLDGLQSNRLFHYRLVAIDNYNHRSLGADRTFSTLPGTRVSPRAVRVSVFPRVQRKLPARVTVSGEVVLPAMVSSTQACSGFVDITFRVRTIAIQMLRAGIHRDCTFSLTVRFSSRRRLLGGHVLVQVLFVGNRFLHRLAAPVQAVQLG